MPISISLLLKGKRPDVLHLTAKRLPFIKGLKYLTPIFKSQTLFDIQKSQFDKIDLYQGFDLISALEQLDCL